MEENNRKGPGIFYAVVGVATLVVAIIGATFAYFSANAQDDNTITGTTASAGGIDLAVTKVTDTSTNLIPLNLRVDDGDSDSVDQFDKAMTGKCIDANGNNVCQIYKVVVKNKSTTSTIQIRGYLTLSSTATNMYYRLINLTTEDDASTGVKVNYSTDVQATTDGTKGNLTVGGNSDGTGADVASKSLAAEATSTYYVVVWLEEMGAAQETSDAAKTFDGKVEFEAVDAAGHSSGITASFTGA